MKFAARPNRPFANPAVALAALVCTALAARAQSPAQPPAPPASSPSAAPATQSTQTAGQRYAQLARTAKRSAAENAEYVGLHFLLSIGVGDGPNAAYVVDEIGYQPLPIEGPLLEDPPRPVRAADLARLVAGRPDANVNECPSGALQLLDRTAMRSVFPAVADWMLPGDFALVSRPQPEILRNWVRQPGCIVVRVRGSQAKVLGGNLFEAFLPPRPAPPASDSAAAP